MRAGARPVQFLRTAAPAPQAVHPRRGAHERAARGAAVPARGGPDGGSPPPCGPSPWSTCAPSPSGTRATAMTSSGTSPCTRRCSLSAGWSGCTATGSASAPTARSTSPAQGPAVLVGNHSGTLPFDAMMVWTDVILRCRRLPRPVADYFVPGLPFVSTLYARAGVVGGSVGNLRALLEAGELLLIFPEGVPGILQALPRALPAPGRSAWAMRSWPSATRRPWCRWASWARRSRCRRWPACPCGPSASPTCPCRSRPCPCRCATTSTMASPCASTRACAPRTRTTRRWCAAPPSGYGMAVQALVERGPAAAQGGVPVSARAGLAESPGRAGARREHSGWERACAGACWRTGPCAR